MLCCDTGKQDAMVRVQGMAVAEAVDIGDALAAIRGHGKGTGEICIPLVNGIFDKLKVAFTKYREKQKKH